MDRHIKYDIDTDGIEINIIDGRVIIADASATEDMGKDTPKNIAAAEKKAAELIEEWKR